MTQLKEDIDTARKNDFDANYSKHLQTNMLTAIQMKSLK